jgi:hypothetical protein
MALIVHIIPSGDSIQPTGQSPTTLEALHSWVAKTTEIKETDQIILTSKGKHVQQQTLLTEVGSLGCMLYVVLCSLTSSRMNSTCMTVNYSPRPSGASQ